MLLGMLMAQFASLSSLMAAPGDLDLGFDPGSIVDGTILSTAVQPDGKVLVAGDFGTVRGAVRNKIARLNTDGTADLSFDPGLGANAAINAIALQSDGKVVVGGNFTQFGAGSWNFIARLNADGSIDATFNPGAGAGNYVRALALQPDGKVVMGGDFDTVNSTNRNRIARLHPNGNLDLTFDPGTGADNSVQAVALQTDGKVILGGSFTGVNGTTNRFRIARLNANGSLDNTFNPGSGANNLVQSVAVQPDGKVVLGGTFTSINSSNRSYLARLNTNGTVDASFAIGTGPDNYVYCVGLQAGGRLVFGGAFTTVSGTSRYYLARLDPNGTLESTFNSSAGANQIVHCLAVHTNDQVVAGGEFTAFNGVSRSRVVRLSADGDLDSNFVPNYGVNNQVLAVATQSDGKALIGGQFTSIQLTGRNRIARLTGAGGLDGTFNPGLGANDSVQGLILQTNSMVLLGGKFTTVGGMTRQRTARIKSDGTIDTAFNTGTSANGVVNGIALQPDGKVVLGGDFTLISGTNRNHIGRLNADGSLDTTFNPGTGADNNTVFCVALQSDGKVLLGGTFTTINGTNRNRIARLNSNGSLDTSFTASVANSDVRSIVVQTNGKVLIGGWFFKTGSTTRNRIARLNADGTLDSGFSLTAGADSNVEALALQPDGKILVGGLFTMMNGVSRNRIARLNSDGTLDAAFDPGTGANGPVYSIAVQADTKVLIAGAFTSFNGVTRGYVARLFGDLNIPSPIPLMFQSSNTELVLLWANPSFALESAPDVLGPYLPIPGATSPYTNPLTGGQKYFRLKTN